MAPGTEDPTHAGCHFLVVSNQQSMIYETVAPYCVAADPRRQHRRATDRRQAVQRVRESDDDPEGWL